MDNAPVIPVPEAVGAGAPAIPAPEAVLDFKALLSPTFDVKA